MELKRLLKTITLLSLAGSAVLLLVLHWTGRGAETGGFIFGLGVSVGSGWLYYYLINRADGKDIARSMRLMGSAFSLRLLLGCAALLAAHSCPRLDVIATAVGLLAVPVLTYLGFLGAGLGQELKRGR